MAEFSDLFLEARKLLKEITNYKEPDLPHHRDLQEEEEDERKECSDCNFCDKNHVPEQNIAVSEHLDDECEVEEDDDPTSKEEYREIIDKFIECLEKIVVRLRRSKTVSKNHQLMKAILRDIESVRDFMEERHFPTTEDFSMVPPSKE